ncbi:4-hydroxythreonine-4-phosphate dehydrogenase PdxA [Spelaeicoccus albus]|uniref:4-hydroxythreonine-4-phosphate dehydrogenase n=1 Tax=Spelaeicoccus albus TaxID=1280376 RepID=A0A7Z0D0B3_9MICO|nr:4-hydroxythreonine-4-phosphate dehydrogenase PdxA [Spelaeicoccus albus]NYI67149.1 4-hydroxythreonine-4-phosphate dehydrogenase [Spelaeicoccus albus]
MTPRQPRIALTFGDPAGVGGELAATLLASPEVYAGTDVLAVASADEVDRASRHANVSPEFADRIGAGRPVLADPGRRDPLPDVLGRVGEDTGRWALDGLRHALKLVRAGEADGICFTPLNKTSLHLAGMREHDELRWFARQLEFTGVTSELNVLDKLWTARVTSHIALADVPDKITADAVAATVTMLDESLRDADIEHPRIGVAALNPHAGENGSFGRQEIDEIEPGVRAARESGIDVAGPFPSDTVFLKARAGAFDGVVTMYHDQGQIAMKMMGFDKGVTVQGGLPIPIATPAHGSAFDIAGTGKANPQATFNAFRLAATMAARRMTQSAHK